MRVMLINPPALLVAQKFVPVYQPLGLGYVAAAIEKAGHDVYVLDALAEGWNKFSKLEGAPRLQGLTYQQITERVKRVAPQVVGITSLFYTQLPALSKQLMLLRKPIKQL